MPNSRAPRASVPAVVKALALTGLSLLMLGNARATSSLKTLHNFCNVGECEDGLFPMAKLVRDSDGNYFGATQSGAFTTDNGTIFELERRGAKYKFRTIYTFCEDDETCPEQPGNLILGADGSIYGTTVIGGRNLGGTVFKLMPNANRKKWKLVTLYSFCAKEDCKDGQSISGGLTYQGQEQGIPYDGTSPLYGTSYYGGEKNGGTVYKLTFKPGKHVAIHTIIHDFCFAQGCTDGVNPFDALLIDISGNLYGTAGGGAFGADAGLVFQLTPQGDDYAYTVLHNFCASANCADGKLPSNLRLFDDALFGAAGGGATNNGLIFKLMPNGANSKETILYNFCSLANCADGASPGALAIDANGDIYGGTGKGSVHDPVNAGVIFKLQGKRESVLYQFCSEANCTDGPWMSAPLAIDPDGHLLGVTRYGGPGKGGTAFEFTP